MVDEWKTGGDQSYWTRGWKYGRDGHHHYSKKSCYKRKWKENEKKFWRNSKWERNCILWQQSARFHKIRVKIFSLRRVHYDEKIKDLRSFGHSFVSLWSAFFSAISNVYGHDSPSIIYWKFWWRSLKNNFSLSFKNKSKSIICKISDKIEGNILQKWNAHLEKFMVMRFFTQCGKFGTWYWPVVTIFWIYGETRSLKST